MQRAEIRRDFFIRKNPLMLIIFQPWIHEPFETSNKCLCKPEKISFFFQKICFHKPLKTQKPKERFSSFRGGNTLKRIQKGRFGNIPAADKIPILCLWTARERRAAQQLQDILFKIMEQRLTCR
jgi:hypothetical protein